MKKYCLALLVITVFLASSAMAIDCPSATVANIQVEGNVIFVFPTGQNWHLVGSLSDMGTKEKYAALLAAQMAGKQVTIRFPDGYNCSAYDLSIPSLMVRTIG